jgi:hypothetical protein
MLNKLMWICQTHEKLDEDEVIEHWIDISNEGLKALKIGNTQVPSIYKIKANHNTKASSKKRKYEAV